MPLCGRGRKAGRQRYEPSLQERSQRRIGTFSLPTSQERLRYITEYKLFRTLNPLISFLYLGFQPSEIFPIPRPQLELFENNFISFNGALPVQESAGLQYKP